MLGLDYSVSVRISVITDVRELVLSLTRLFFPLVRTTTCQRLSIRIAEEPGLPRVDDEAVERGGVCFRYQLYRILHEELFRRLLCPYRWRQKRYVGYTVVCSLLLHITEPEIWYFQPIYREATKTEWIFPHGAREGRVFAEKLKLGPEELDPETTGIRRVQVLVIIWGERILKNEKNFTSSALFPV